MSLFNNKNTSWHSSTVPMLGGDPDDIVKNSVLSSILLDRPITEDLLVNQMSGFGARALYYYNYCKNNVPKMMMQGSSISKTPSTAVVKNLLIKYIVPQLTQGEPQPIDLTAVTMGDPEPEDFAFKYLSDNECKMNYGSFKLTEAPPSFPYTTAQKDIYYSYSELVADGFVKIYYVATDIGVTPNLGENFIDSGSNGEVIIRDEVSDFYLPPEEDYPPWEYQFTTARYFFLNHKQEKIGEPRYWIYAHDSGLYPIMDNALEKVDTSEYFPIIPLIDDRLEVWGNAYKNAADPEVRQLWRHCNAMAKLLQFDYVDVGEGLMGTDINPNPDYDYLEFAHVSLCIPLQTEEDDSIKYLYKYFLRLRELSTTNKANFEHDILIGSEPAYSEVVLQNEYGFKTKLAWNYIDLEVMTGSIGAVGTTTRSTFTGTNVNLGSSEDLTYSTGKVTFMHQVDETTYHILTVSGLTHFNYIHDKEIKTDLAQSLELNEEGKLNDDFNIQLEFPTFMSMSPAERNKVIYDGLRIVLNAKVVTKLKWYQTSIFKLIITIVAIVWTAYTGDGNLSTFLLNMAASVAISFGISIALEILIDTLGINSKLATALVIAALIYVGYSTENITTADTLVDQVKWSASYSSMVVNKAVNMELEDIQSQLDELKEDMAELEDLKEELGLNYTPLDVYSIFGIIPEVPPVESAEEFMYRTTRTNPGILSLAVPSVYVDSMLTLPDVHHYNGLSI